MKESRRLRLLPALALLLALAVGPTLAEGAEGLAAGQEALDQGRFNEAIEILSGALDSSGLTPQQRAEAHYLIGRAFEGKGFYGDAERNYGWALALGGYNQEYMDAFRKMRWRNHPGPP